MNRKERERNALQEAEEQEEREMLEKPAGRQDTAAGERDADAIAAAEVLEASEDGWRFRHIAARLRSAPLPECCGGKGWLTVSYSDGRPSATLPCPCGSVAPAAEPSTEFPHPDYWWNPPTPGASPDVVEAFTTHHKGEHCIRIWGGKPWLCWRHPDGQWVTETPVTFSTTNVLAIVDRAARASQPVAVAPASPAPCYCKSDHPNGWNNACPRHGALAAPVAVAETAERERIASKVLRVMNSGWGFDAESSWDMDDMKRFADEVVAALAAPAPQAHPGHDIEEQAALEWLAYGDEFDNEHARVIQRMLRAKAAPAPAQPAPSEPSERSTVENAFDGVFTRLERATAEQRAELFFRFESRWCWDRGQSYDDGSHDTCGPMPARAPLTVSEEVRDPSDYEIGDACMSYRHDYGLLDGAARKQLEWEAVEWLRAWRKAGAVLAVLAEPAT